MTSMSAILFRVATRVYGWAVPHSGQNLDARGMDFPQLKQNFVADAASPPEGAADPAG